MYYIIELKSQAEILFALTYETRHYDLSFMPQGIILSSVI